MTDPKPLVPPDRARCQCEITTTPSPFTMGGDLRKKTERCPAKTSRILTERHAGPDGQTGAMSVCDSCWEVFQRQFAKAGAGSIAENFYIEVLPSAGG